MLVRSSMCAAWGEQNSTKNVTPPDGRFDRLMGFKTRGKELDGLLDGGEECDLSVVGTYPACSEKSCVRLTERTEGDGLCSAQESTESMDCQIELKECEEQKIQGST